MLNNFLCACWPSVCILQKNVYSDPLLIFQLGLFFVAELYEFLYIFGY